MSAANDTADTVPSTARERLMVYGSGSLADSELLALILGGREALPHARDALDALDGIGGLVDVVPAEISTVPGIGPAGATRLVAAVELGRRLDAVRRLRGRTLRRPAEVVDFVRGRLRGLQQEHFLIVGLDARQRVRLVRTVAIGSLAKVDVHPREIFRPLIRAGVHSVVLVHNHPSGDPEPSEADIDLTHRMVDVGRLCGIPVLDHCIVTDDASSSLAALGLLS